MVSLSVLFGGVNLRWGEGEKLCVTLLCHFITSFFSEVEIALGSEFNAWWNSEFAEKFHVERARAFELVFH